MTARRTTPEPDVDLGDGHALTFTSWKPADNPGNRDTFGTPVPCLERAGAVIHHRRPDGSECPAVAGPMARYASIHFDLPEQRPWWDASSLWQVESWDPLTISPSILCLTCGDHGFVRLGRWVRA